MIEEDALVVVHHSARECAVINLHSTSVAQILFSRRHLKERPVLHLGAELSVFLPAK